MVTKRNYTSSQLEEMTVIQLRNMCQDFGIAGMSKKRKDIIIENLMIKMDKPATSVSMTKAPSSSPSSSKDEVYNGIPTTVIITPDNSSRTGYSGTVRVSCGASSSKYNVVGKSVGAVSEILRGVLNIPTGANGIVNGENVRDSIILKDGDVLEYLKVAGKKG